MSLQILSFLTFFAIFVAYATPLAQFDTYLQWANRGDGTLGQYLTKGGDSEVSVFSINGGDSEPMYLMSDNPQCFGTNDDTFVFVGDRKNNKIWAYTGDTIELVSSLDIDCNGIFHSTTNPLNQIWLTCDEDNTVIAIDVSDAQNLQVLNGGLPIPIADSVGYKPHDMFTTSSYAYATLLSTAEETAGIGFVVQYDVTTFTEVNRLQVGGDPHVFISDVSDFLYVAAQSTGTVYKIDAETLVIIDQMQINGAHGIAADRNFRYLYVTDITSTDGVGSLYVIDLDTFMQIPDSPFDSVVGNPHNVIIGVRGKTLWITNSADGSVAEYKLNPNSGKISDGELIFDVQGSVPFGITISCFPKD